VLHFVLETAPQEVYDDEEVNERTDLVYQHIYANHGGFIGQIPHPIFFQGGMQ
jgi:hypothetical protein